MRYHAKHQNDSSKNVPVTSRQSLAICSHFRQIAAIAESKILLGVTLHTRHSAPMTPKTLKLVLK